MSTVKNTNCRSHGIKLHGSLCRLQDAEIPTCNNVRLYAHFSRCCNCHYRPTVALNLNQKVTEDLHIVINIR